MRYMSEKEIIAINAALIKRLSPTEQIGIKDVKLLNSAVNRPRQSVFGEDAYKTVFEKAAALFESLTLNHPFHNANKRTASVATITLLKKNGYNFRMEQKQFEDFIVEVVNKRYSFETIAQTLKEYAQKR